MCLCFVKKKYFVHSNCIAISENYSNKRYIYMFGYRSIQKKIYLYFDVFYDVKYMGDPGFLINQRTL